MMVMCLKTRWTWLLVAVLLVASAANSQSTSGAGCGCTASGTATYRLTFTADWTDPRPPSSAHWSSPIGTSHSPCYTMWREGKLASTGIRYMAEYGSTSTLRNEFDSAENRPHALSTIRSHGIGRASGTSRTTFKADRFHPLVSVTSMIAPSPDWFVGLDSLNLCSGSEWNSSITVNAYPWDAGTDSGAAFTSSNLVTRPYQPIAEITTCSSRTTSYRKASCRSAPMGTFRFDLVSTDQQEAGTDPKCEACTPPPPALPSAGPCDNNRCANGGKCIPVRATGYRCECNHFFSGVFCQDTWLTRERFQSVMNSVSQLSQRLDRLETSQNALLAQQQSDTGALRQSLTGVSDKTASLDSRVQALEASLSRQQEVEAPTVTMSTTTDSSQSCVRRAEGDGQVMSHAYTFSTATSSFEALCNMTIDGGGWTVIQRSTGASNTAFNKNWEEYKTGFGDMDGDFWLGNDNIHALTSSSSTELRIDMVTEGGAHHFVKYSSMRVEDEANNYRLHIGSTEASSTGTRAGLGMDYHDSLYFSTMDSDNDSIRGNCATGYRSGWWYKNCYAVHPHGISMYFYPIGVLRFFEMKVRPVQ